MALPRGQGNPNDRNLGNDRPAAHPPNRTEVNPNRPEVNPNRPEANPNRPEANPNRPEVNPNRPEVNPNRPEVNPNRPEVNPNRPEVNPNRPEVNPNRPEVIPRIFPLLLHPADRWYFTKEQLENTPSRRHGYEANKELSYRQQTANFIQDMGQKLKVSQLCINTAIVYMHRFYVFHSFLHFPWHSMAAAALFLAAKVEEQHRKLEHVIKVGHVCRNANGPPLEPASDRYLQLQADLVFNENVLLQTLGFDVAIDHPHTHVVKCCHLVRASKDLAQTSYFLASNSLHLTTMCLQYKPTVVACFCIHLACKWSNWEIPLSSENKAWHKYIDPTVTADMLQQLTCEFLNIFENCPSRLKEKIMSIGETALSNALTAMPHSPFDPEPRRLAEERAQQREAHASTSHASTSHASTSYASTSYASTSHASTSYASTSHRSQAGIENEQSQQEPQPHHSRHRPSTSSGSGHHSSSSSSQHRDREYREKKEREKQAALAAMRLSLLSSQPQAGPSGIKSSSSHHHHHRGGSHHGNTAGRSGSIGPSISQLDHSGKISRSHHGASTSSRSHSLSIAGSSRAVEPKDILREAAKDSTAFGIALAQNHKDLASGGSSSSSSSRNNNSFAMNNAINSGADCKDTSGGSSSSSSNKYSLLKPNALLDSSSTTSSSLNLSAAKASTSSSDTHKQQQQQRMNHQNNGENTSSKRTMMSMEQQQNNSSANLSSASTSRSSLALDSMASGATTSTNRTLSVTKHEHSRRHLLDDSSSSARQQQQQCRDLFMPDKKHSVGGSSANMVAQSASGSGATATSYGAFNTKSSSSSVLATSQHQQQKLSSKASTSSNSRSSSPFASTSNGNGAAAAAVVGTTMQPQDSLKSVLKSKTNLGLLPHPNHSTASKHHLQHHSQQSNGNSSTSTSNSMPNFTVKEETVTVKEEPHQHLFAIKTEVPTTSTPSSHSSATLPPNTSYPVTMKKPSLFSPEQTPYEINPQDLIYTTGPDRAVPANDGINTRRPGTGLQLMNMLSPLTTSPPTATSASSSNEGSGGGSSSRKRKRNYSTSSEPELRPVMKKIDQVEGFENLMRDSTIGIEKLQQVPDLITPIPEGPQKERQQPQQQDLPFGIAREMQPPPNIVTPFANSSTSSQSDLNTSSSTTIKIQPGTSTSSTTSSNRPLVNGIELNPGLISSLLKEIPPIPHLPLNAVHLTTNQSAALQTNASGTSMESQQAATMVVAGPEKDKERHHHKSKKKNKEKHRHKDKKDKDKSREDKDKKRKHKDKERHSSSSSSIVVGGGSSSGSTSDKKHKDKDKHQKVAQTDVTQPIKIKIHKDKIQPMVIQTSGNNSASVASNSSNNKPASMVPTMPLKIKIPKDMIKTEYNNTTTNHDSSLGASVAQPPIGLKIKIPKDILNNCNSNSNASFHNTSYHHSTGSDVTTGQPTTATASSSSSSRKRERERVSPQDGVPPVKMSRSSHSSSHHHHGKSSESSKQNGRHSSSSGGYHNNHPPNHHQAQQHQPKVSGAETSG